MITYVKGQIVWIAHIRWWEKKEPKRGIIRENGQSPYGYDPEYKHNVYWVKEHVFLTRQAARDAIEQWREKRFAEEDRKLEKILDAILGAP